MSNVFLVVKPGKIYSLYRILYPKRIEPYSATGTIVSPNKILLIWVAVKELQVAYWGVSREGKFHSGYIRSIWSICSLTTCRITV